MSFANAGGAKSNTGLRLSIFNQDTVRRCDPASVSSGGDRLKPTGGGAEDASRRASQARRKSSTAVNLSTSRDSGGQGRGAPNRASSVSPSGRTKSVNFASSIENPRRASSVLAMHLSGDRSMDFGSSSVNPDTTYGSMSQSSYGQLEELLKPSERSMRQADRSLKAVAASIPENASLFNSMMFADDAHRAASLVEKFTASGSRSQLKSADNVVPDTPGLAATSQPGYIPMPAGIEWMSHADIPPRAPPEKGTKDKEGDEEDASDAQEEEGQQVEGAQGSLLFGMSTKCGCFVAGDVDGCFAFMPSRDAAPEAIEGTTEKEPAAESNTSSGGSPRNDHQESSQPASPNKKEPDANDDYDETDYPVPSVLSIDVAAFGMAALRHERTAAAPIITKIDWDTVNHEVEDAVNKRPKGTKPFHSSRDQGDQGSSPGSDHSGRSSSSWQQSSFAKGAPSSNENDDDAPIPLDGGDERPGSDLPTVDSSATVVSPMLGAALLAEDAGNANIADANSGTVASALVTFDHGSASLVRAKDGMLVLARVAPLCNVDEVTSLLRESKWGAAASSSDRDSTAGSSTAMESKPPRISCIPVVSDMTEQPRALLAGYEGVALVGGGTHGQVFATGGIARCEDAPAQDPRMLYNTDVFRVTVKSDSPSVPNEWDVEGVTATAKVAKMTHKGAIASPGIAHHSAVLYAGTTVLCFGGLLDGTPVDPIKKRVASEKRNHRANAQSVTLLDREIRDFKVSVSRATTPQQLKAQLESSSNAGIGLFTPRKQGNGDSGSPIQLSRPPTAATEISNMSPRGNASMSMFTHRPSSSHQQQLHVVDGQSCRLVPVIDSNKNTVTVVRAGCGPDQGSRGTRSANSSRPLSRSSISQDAAATLCVSNGLYAFDVEKSAWSHVQAIGEAPTPRIHHSACVYGNWMIVTGGMTQQRTPMNDSIHASPTSARPETPQGLLSNQSFGNLSTGGGRTWLPSNEVFLFQCTQHVWIRIDCVPASIPRLSHHVCVATPSEVMVIGGGASVARVPAADLLKFAVAKRKIVMQQLQKTDERPLLVRSGSQIDEHCAVLHYSDSLSSNLQDPRRQKVLKMRQLAVLTEGESSELRNKKLPPNQLHLCLRRLTDPGPADRKERLRQQALRAHDEQRQQPAKVKSDVFARKHFELPSELRQMSRTDRLMTIERKHERAVKIVTPNELDNIIGRFYENKHNKAVKRTAMRKAVDESVVGMQSVSIAERLRNQSIVDKYKTPVEVNTQPAAVSAKEEVDKLPVMDRLLKRDATSRERKAALHDKYVSEAREADQWQRTPYHKPRH